RSAVGDACRIEAHSTNSFLGARVVVGVHRVLKEKGGFALRCIPLRGDRDRGTNEDAVRTFLGDDEGALVQTESATKRRRDDERSTLPHAASFRSSHVCHPNVRLSDTLNFGNSASIWQGPARRVI